LRIDLPRHQFGGPFRGNEVYICDAHKSEHRAQIGRDEIQRRLRMRPGLPYQY